MNLRWTMHNVILAYKGVRTLLIVSMRCQT